MRSIRQLIGATTLNPVLLTAAERTQYEGYLRRDDTNAAVLEQAAVGMTVKEIVRKPDIAVAWSGGCSVVSNPMYSAPGKARSRSTCRGLMRNGRQEKGTAWIYGGD